MKLSIKQLRVGNIIQKGEERIVITPSNISEIFQTLEDYTPLNLSEEVLLSSGFHKLRKDYCYALDKSDNYHLIYTGKIGIFYKKGQDTNGIPIRYFHELQNVLYSMDLSGSY